MSAAEIMILLIVGIVVVGPKRLPTMMRTAGRWISKMRRMSSDLRSQSGIDRIIREEGLEKEIRELRSLKESLSKQALLDSLVKAADAANAPVKPKLPARPATTTSSLATGAAAKVAELATSSDGKTSDAKSTDAKSTDAKSDAAKDVTPSDAKDDTPSEFEASLAVGAVGAIAAGAAGAVPSPLYKPAEGTIARGVSLPRAGVSVRAKLSLPSPPRAPYRSMREREFPACGPDHYDALPDDLAEDEEAVDAPGAPLASVAGDAPTEERVESIA